jgi:hypothetical protein
LSASGKLVNEATAMGAGYAPSAAAAIGASKYGQMPAIQPQAAAVFGAQNVGGSTTGQGMAPASWAPLMGNTQQKSPNLQYGASQIHGLPVTDALSNIPTQIANQPSTVVDETGQVMPHQQAVNIFQNELIKKGMTARVANKIQSGATSAITMQQIDKLINDPDILNYAGVTGRIQLASDAFKSSMGVDVAAYDKYREMLSKFGILNDQITQYFGSSIQPSQKEHLDTAMNAFANPLNSQQGVKDIWTSFKNVFQPEFEKTRQIGVNPEPYLNPLKKQDLENGVATIDVKGTGHTLDEFKAAAQKNGVKDVEGFIRSYKEAKGIK